MKALLLGFKAADGSGPVCLLSGPDSSHDEQLALLREVHHGKYPKGINRVEFVVFDTREVAIKTEPKKSEPIEE